MATSGNRSPFLDCDGLPALSQYTHMCIYKIVNKINGKVYVGQTVRNAGKRWASHFHKKPSHHSSLIHNALHKYGIIAFWFEVIESAATKEHLDLRERYWIKKLNSVFPSGYNLTLGGQSGRVFTKETKLKMKASAHKRWGPNTKRRRWEGVPEEEKARIIHQNRSNAKKGKPSPKRGRALSQETIEKIRTSKAGKKVPAKYRPIIDSNGIRYRSIQESTEIIGCSRSSLHRVLSGDFKTLFGLTYSYCE